MELKIQGVLPQFLGFPPCLTPNLLAGYTKELFGVEQFWESHCLSLCEYLWQSGLEAPAFFHQCKVSPHEADPCCSAPAAALHSCLERWNETPFLEVRNKSTAIFLCRKQHFYSKAEPTVMGEHKSCVACKSPMWQCSGFSGSGGTGGREKAGGDGTRSHPTCMYTYKGMPAAQFVCKHWHWQNWFLWFESSRTDFISGGSPDTLIHGSAIPEWS